MIFTDGIKIWDIPRGEKLSEFERLRILNRLKKFGSIWGEVYLNDETLRTVDDIKEDLQKDGIDFQELEGGGIMYTTIAEDEKQRKSSPFFKDGR